ncbi:MAG: hypothetical protein ABIS51_18455 [Sphingomonas sp.]
MQRIIFVDNLLTVTNGDVPLVVVAKTVDGDTPLTPEFTLAPSATHAFAVEDGVYIDFVEPAPGDS